MSLIDSIISVESGGDPNARNPRSSASGVGQFLNSTWIDTIKAARPDIANGKSDAELIALKSDPQLSRQMTEAYAAQNGDILSKAGLPVTPGTTYLAHFAGPQGAIKILQADPNASAGDILGASVLKANPFLKGMTAQGLQAWAAKKMGGQLPQPGVQTAQASPAIAPRAPFSPAPQAAPVFTQQPTPAAPATQQQPLGLAALQQMPALLSQIPQLANPLLNPPRKPVDISRLKAAFAPENRGFFIGA